VTERNRLHYEIGELKAERDTLAAKLTAAEPEIDSLRAWKEDAQTFMRETGVRLLNAGYEEGEFGGLSDGIRWIIDRLTQERDGYRAAAEEYRKRPLVQPSVTRMRWLEDALAQAEQDSKQAELRIKELETALVLGHNERVTLMAARNDLAAEVTRLAALRAPATTVENNDRRRELLDDLQRWEKALRSEAGSTPDLEIADAIMRLRASVRGRTE
jgi:chromosome segregation ATPase